MTEESKIYASVIEYCYSKNYHLLGCYYAVKNSYEFTQLYHKLREQTEEYLGSVEIENCLDVIKFCYSHNFDSFYSSIACNLSIYWMKLNGYYIHVKSSESDTFNDYQLLAILDDLDSTLELYEIVRYLTILIYYVPELRDQGLYLSDWYIMNKSIKKDKSLVVKNMKFYVNKLENIESISFNYTNLLIDNPKIKGSKYNPCNPSIIKIDDGYLVNIRFVNFDQEKAIKYDSNEIDNQIRTRNILVKYDKDFNMISQNEIIDKSWKSKLDKSKVYVHGMEDILLFKRNDGIYFTFTSLDIEPYNTPMQNIAKLPDYPVDGYYEITDIKLFESPKGKSVVEKNWLPISYNINNNKYTSIGTSTSTSTGTYNKSLYANTIIYHHEPLTLITYDISDSSLRKITPKITKETTNDNIDYSRFRGSAPPIKLPDESLFDTGWLSIIHEVIFDDNNARTYIHKFVHYDKDFNSIEDTSLPFYFDHLGIEFCRSMCYSHDEKNSRLILSVGIEDKEPKLYSIDINDIVKLFSP